MVKIKKANEMELYIINSLKNLGYVFNEVELLSEIYDYWYNSTWKYYNSMLDYLTKDEDYRYLSCEECLERLIDKSIIKIMEN